MDDETREAAMSEVRSRAAAALGSRLPERAVSRPEACPMSKHCRHSVPPEGSFPWKQGGAMMVLGMRSGWRGTAACWAVVMLLAAPVDAWADASPAEPRIVVDGSDWMESTSIQRQAFLVGVANMIVAESAYAKRHGAQTPPVSNLLTKAVSEMTLREIEERITRWYEANPSRMSMPVMGVLWQDIVGR